MLRVRPAFMRSWLAILAVSGTAAAPASAQRQIAPPGNSGVTQYLETVPGASGDEAPRARGEGRRSGAKRVLGPKTRRALQSRGADGQRLADLLDSTPAPKPRARKRARSNPSPSRSLPAPASVGAGRSPLESTADALLGRSDGDKGAGAALPIILIGSTILLALVAARRRRA